MIAVLQQFSAQTYGQNCTQFDYPSHAEQIQYGYPKHMQHTRFFVFTTLIEVQHTSYLRPQSYGADTYLTASYISSRCESPSLIDVQQMFNRPIYALSHARSMFPFLQEAPMNNLNNPILLLFRHLVITRQAESSSENIGPNIHSRAFYISICTSSTVSLNCDKRVGPIYRLHMHGLCKWSDGITTICSALDWLKCILLLYIDF